MKIIKKILRIITILLPAFIAVMIPKQASAYRYGITDLPVYSPSIYDTHVSRWVGSPYTWAIDNGTPKRQTVNYRTLIDDQCESSAGSYISTVAGRTYINFNAYPHELPTSSNPCAFLNGMWYEYATIHIADYNLSADGSTDVSVEYNKETVDSNFKIVEGTGFNLTSMYPDLFSNHITKYFTIPFYYDPSVMDTLHFEDPTTVDIQPNFSFSLGSSKNTFYDDTKHINISAFYYDDDQNNWYDYTHQCQVYPQSGDNTSWLDVQCNLSFRSESRIDFSTETPVYFQLSFDAGSFGAENDTLYLNNFFFHLDGSVKTDGTWSLQQSGNNTSSAPKGILDETNTSFFQLFNFNFLNPFAVLYEHFTSPENCVDLPVIAGAIHLPYSHICSIYPRTLINLTTPVFSIVGLVMTTGYFIKWLRDDEGVVVNVKGGKK